MMIGINIHEPKRYYQDYYPASPTLPGSFGSVTTQSSGGSVCVFYTEIEQVRAHIEELEKLARAMGEQQPAEEVGA